MLRLYLQPLFFTPGTTAIRQATPLDVTVLVSLLRSLGTILGNEVHSLTWLVPLVNRLLLQYFECLSIDNDSLIQDKTSRSGALEI